MTLDDVLTQSGSICRIPRNVRPRPMFLVVGVCLIGCAAAVTYASTGDVATMVLGVASVAFMLATMLWPSRCAVFDLGARRVTSGRQSVPFSGDMSLRIDTRERRGSIVIPFYVLVFSAGETTLDITESDDPGTTAAIARYLAQRLGLPQEGVDRDIARGTPSRLMRWLPVATLIVFIAIASALRHCGA